jgi:hypothetical protein
MQGVMARTKQTARRGRGGKHPSTTCRNGEATLTLVLDHQPQVRMAVGNNTEVKEEAKSRSPQWQGAADVERGRNRDIDGDSNKEDNDGSVRDSDTDTDVKRSRNSDIGENDDSAGDSDKECPGTSPPALTEVTKLPVLTMSEGNVKAPTTARMMTVTTATEMGHLLPRPSGKASISEGSIS